MLVSSAGSDQRGTSNVTLPTSRTETGPPAGYLSSNIHTIESTPGRPAENHMWGYGYKLDSSVALPVLNIPITDGRHHAVENAANIPDISSSCEPEVECGLPTPGGITADGLPNHAEERNLDLDAMRDAAVLRMQKQQQERNVKSYCTGIPLHLAVTGT